MLPRISLQYISIKQQSTMKYFVLKRLCKLKKFNEVKNVFEIDTNDKSNKSAN